MVETYYQHSYDDTGPVEAMQLYLATQIGEGSNFEEIEKWCDGHFWTDYGHSSGFILTILDEYNDKKMPIVGGDWVVKDGNIFYTLPDVIFQKRFAKQIDMFKLPNKYAKPVDMEIYSAVSPDGPYPAAIVAKVLDGLKGGRGVTWDYSADGEEIIFKDDVPDYPPYLDRPKPIPPRRVK